MVTEKHRHALDVESVAALQPREGGFGEMLDFYLDGYLEGKPREYRQIPEIIDGLLRTLLNGVVVDAEAEIEAEHESAWVVERMYMYGGVPRCVVAGMPSKFWKYAEYFAGIASDPRVRASSLADTVDYLSHGPADVDFKVEHNSGTNNQFGFYLASRMGVEDVEDIKLVTYPPVGERKVSRYRFEVETGEMVVEVSFGQIPTNPDREGIEIKFFEKGEQLGVGKPAFMVHIGYLPEDAQDALEDKRVGDTTKKQDWVLAKIKDEGLLWYEMLDKAYDAMSEAEQFVDIGPESDLGNIAELLMRGLRINLLHPNEELVDFGDLLPLFERKSLMQIRNRMLVAYRDKEVIPGGIMKLVERELMLCLAIDPYLTGQFMRDTGFYKLIPGLAAMNFDDWQAMLHSKALQLRLDVGGLHPARGDKNELLVKHRAAYLQSDIPDGVVRFLRALEECGVVDWGRRVSFSDFSRLFERPVDEIRLFHTHWDDPDLDELVIGWRDSKDGEKGLALIVEDGVSGQRLVLMGGQGLMRGFSGVNDILDFLSRGQRADRDDSFANVVKPIIESERERHWGFAEDKERVDALRELYEALMQADIGLTEEEIAGLVTGYSSLGKKGFDENWLWLKKQGLLQRRCLPGAAVPLIEGRIDLYSLGGMKDANEAKGPAEAARNKGFVNLLVSNGNMFPGGSSTISGFVNKFSRFGVRTIGAMRALVESDFRSIRYVSEKKGYWQVQEFLKAYDDYGSQIKE